MAVDRMARPFRRQERRSEAVGGAKRKENASQVVMYVLLTILLVLTFIPVVLLLVLSLKDNGQIYGRFWAMPRPYRWENYIVGWRGIRGFIFNSVLTSGVSTFANVVLASLAGYVFARHRFPGKEIIYTAFLSLMMIPYVLTLIPAYVVIRRLHLDNTYWGLILPWASGGQVFGLLLTRSFFSSLPEEFFDAARIDGASELDALLRICVPLSRPILVTLAIMRIVTTYNNFLWPLLVIGSPKMQVVSVGLTQFSSEIGVTDVGAEMAAYVLATVPLLIVFAFGMRYYIQGITAGGIKA
jgi:ABC-type glycerol-3-phosphate transport system permease component